MQFKQVHFLPTPHRTYMHILKNIWGNASRLKNTSTDAVSKATRGFISFKHIKGLGKESDDNT